jgi:putative SOS response-associated peptidase YedK
MCYDVQTKLETLLKRAIRFHDLEGIKRIREELEPYAKDYFHTSGFSHQQLLIYQNDQPTIPSPASWVLIPHWVKDQKQKSELWNKTINARGETIFEKPSFRDSANNKRCILYVDGFFEHHYFKGKAYPFFIYRKDKEPLAIAGLWGEWLDKESGEIVKSFTLVTTKANKLLDKIHNNPKLKEARMPLILSRQEEDDWLNSKEKTKELIKVYPADELTYRSVHKLRGKTAFGNVAQTSEEFIYPELQNAF